MSVEPKEKRPRKWRLRFFALGLGCLPILLLELCLRVVGWPAQAPTLDPLVDLHHLRPLFSLSSDGQRYEIGPERMDLFRPVGFAVRKPKDVVRVFALGESTTQGEPYSTATAYPAWMQIYLQQATGRQIEVINCGGLSYASYRIKAILDEVLNYQPDLIVLYVGQNEFLEQRSYAGWRDVPLPVAKASGALSSLKITQALRRLFRGAADRESRPAADVTQLTREVDALLDYQNGLDAYHRDDPWREPVVQHYRFNLAEMVQHAQAARVPIILMRPAVNLLDCPPMKFETRSDFSSQDRQQFDAAWQAAQDNSQDRERAKQQLQIAYALDPQHAGVNFFLGRIAFEESDFAAALGYLQAAKQNDVCPLRALTEIQGAVTEIASSYDVPLLDADQLFIDHSPHGLVGHKWLVDHVHPTIEGHQLLGEALTQKILDTNFLPMVDSDWRANSQAAIRQQFISLGEDYFLRGKQRLEGLMLWTQGRAKKIRPTP